MEKIDAKHIESRLSNDGLKNLPVFLRNYSGSIVIAGSYTLDPLADEHSNPHLGPNDLDIWIPFHEEQSRFLSDLLVFMMSSGYSSISTYNQKKYQVDPANPEAIPGAYGRMEYMIDTIYSMHQHSGARKVQIIVLQSKGGKTPEELIKHFDLNISRQYYDGSFLHRPSNVGNDVRAGRITLNSASSVIREQSFPEWVRTMSRIHKYSTKGFEIDPSVRKLLYELLPIALSHLSWMSREDSTYELQARRYILDWNSLVRLHHLLPVIAFTVVPPGKYLSDVRIVLCENPIVPPYHREGYVEYLAKHHNRLQQFELNTMTKPKKSTGRSKSMYLRTNYKRDGKTFTVSVHVSAIVPYPSTKDPQLCWNCTLLPKQCLDTNMQEQVNIRDYLNDDIGGHFVFYFKPKQGDMKAYGVPRALIQHSNHFVPCVDDMKEWSSWSSSGTLVTLGLDSDISFNIPVNQLKTILKPSTVPTRHIYMIVQTDYSWDRSRIVYNRQDDHFEGGFANNCQNDTARTISFLEHVLCCPVEDEDSSTWFESLPVDRQVTNLD
jgi:hypothetical protein